MLHCSLNAFNLRSPSFAIAMDQPAKVNLKARKLILDYALGAAIVALLPIPNIGLGQAIVLVLLNVSLVIGIACLWQFQKGGDLLARVGILFGIAGAILTGFLVWLLIVAVGTEKTGSGDCSGCSAYPAFPDKPQPPP